MTDVSFAVMGLLMAIGLLIAAVTAFPLLAGRAFIYAGIAILCSHAIGIKIVAPISVTAADTVSWISLALMAAMVMFLAGRGLGRTAQKKRTAASEVAR
jgi:hypothetical protein